jgi:hypothetical protein
MEESRLVEDAAWARARIIEDEVCGLVRQEAEQDLTTIDIFLVANVGLKNGCTYILNFVSNYILLYYIILTC